MLLELNANLIIKLLRNNDQKMEEINYWLFFV